MTCLITGKNDEEQLKNREKVFEILNELGATVNKSKCLFFANETEMKLNTSDF